MEFLSAAILLEHLKVLYAEMVDSYLDAFQRHEDNRDGILKTHTALVSIKFMIERVNVERKYSVAFKEPHPHKGDAGFAAHISRAYYAIPQHRTAHHSTRLNNIKETLKDVHIAHWHEQMFKLMMVTLEIMNDIVIYQANTLNVK